ncbi:MAG: AAA family ATPase [Luteolibacter sp.]
MIATIQLQDIGPVAGLEADFGDRLNLVTGDNGLGKTFLLDACWYALTRAWADERTILPGPEAKKDDDPKISYSVVGKAGKEVQSEARFDFQAQSWKGKAARPPIPGLVIYARIDGGFSVWDPARNYWRDSEEGGKRPGSYQFSKSEVWNGLIQPDEGEAPKTICNGLLRDVELWRLRKNAAFDRLQSVLARLSADESESLSIGEGVRLRVDDVVDIPTLNLPYGPVPVTMAAAGMKRVLALAYLLVWAWEEHRRSSEIKKDETTDRIVLLFDEVEAHLHPKWQRVFLPALLEAVESLLLEGNTSSVQIIATTHAPLILGSVEASWKPGHDKLFDFDLVDKKVVFGEREFARLGSAENWLSSESFDLSSGYPIAAEHAIAEADAFMIEFPDPASAPATDKSRIHQALMATLGGDDEYWPYWLPYFEQNIQPGGMAR